MGSFNGGLQGFSASPSLCDTHAKPFTNPFRIYCPLSITEPLRQVWRPPYNIILTQCSTYGYRLGMSYVYFIRSHGPDGLIKIGWSKNPEKRMAYFRASSPVSLDLLFFMEGGESLAEKLHKLFAADHSHGAWFSPSEGILEFIAGQQSASVAELSEPLMSVGAAADFLSVGRDEVLRMCRDGGLTPIYTKGGHRRFSRSQLLDQHGITFK